MTTPAAGGFRLHYIDDSGSATPGITSFTWLRLGPADWADTQQMWLAFRRDLYVRYGVGASLRLHATDLAGGRGPLSMRAGGNARRDGAAIIRDGLRVIGSFPGVSVGTVYRRCSPGELPEVKRALYQDLVTALDAGLRADQVCGMVFMDGDGSDPSYAAAHRTLPAGRRLIEDPVFRSAKTDQWVQMADFAAWAAYQSLHHRRRHTRSWYPRFLAPIDVCGGPVELQTRQDLPIHKRGAGPQDPR